MTLTPTERAVIRHLSLSEPMTKARIAEAAGLPMIKVDVALGALREARLITLCGFRNERGQLLGSGYILTPAGADLCEAMERERAELNAIAAQATREHGEPDGDGLIAQAMQSPRFFSPPEELFRNPVDRVFARKPSILARIKRWFWSAAA